MAGRSRDEISARSGRLARLGTLTQDLIGWPLLAAAILALVAATWRRRSQEVRGGCPLDFVTLTTLGAASGAAILLYPPYFDARFLLPIWPALAVGLAPILLDAAMARGRVVAWSMIGLLGIAVFQSADRIRHEERTTTSWNVQRLIDHLVAKHGSTNIYNVGNCRDWNVSKTGFINEFRATPRDCFVLHDLSRASPEELRRVSNQVDAVVALDRGRIPPGWFAYGPELNKGCDAAIKFFGEHPQFRRVEGFPEDGLPPLLVFTKKR